MKEENEIIEAIGNINNNFIEVSEENGYDYQLELISNGNTFVIRWLDITIWNSDDDSRQFDEDKNEYEPLEQFLKKRIKQLFDNLCIVFKDMKIIG